MKKDKIKLLHEIHEGRDCCVHKVWMYVPWPIMVVVKMTRATWEGDDIEYETYNYPHDDLPEEVKSWFVKDESEED